MRKKPKGQKICCSFYGRNLSLHSKARPMPALGAQRWAQGLSVASTASPGAETSLHAQKTHSPSAESFCGLNRPFCAHISRNGERKTLASLQASNSQVVESASLLAYSGDFLVPKSSIIRGFQFKCSQRPHFSPTFLGTTGETNMHQFQPLSFRSLCPHMQYEV